MRKTYIRPYCGNVDDQRVTIYGAFPGSPIVVVSPVEIHDPWPAIVLQGPEFQINFLYEYLLRLIEATACEESNKWHGIFRRTAERTDIFYKYGEGPWSRIELMEYKFRRDVMRYADIKLAETSILEIVYASQDIFRKPIALPEGVKNGQIELPLVEFLH